MKHSIKLTSTLLALGLPLVADAGCDRYQDSTLTLNLPANITVPDSLPVGSVIVRQAFNGSAPAFIANCPVAIHRWINGRYPRVQDPATGAYHTEVPGVGVRIRMTWADGSSSAAFALHSQGPQYAYGKIPSFTSAEATFYKIGPVTTGTVPAGNIWEQVWLNVSERFRLQIGTPIRFVRPTATCDLAAGDVNRTITFAPIKIADLKDVDFAGQQNFELTANCTDATNVMFRFSGAPAPGNSLLFANTGTANGVALWLSSYLNGAQQTISPNANNVRTVTVSGTRAILPMRAAYHKSGTVGAGTLVSTATVNITYN